MISEYNHEFTITEKHKFVLAMIECNKYGPAIMHLYQDTAIRMEGTYNVFYLSILNQL